MNIYGVVFNDKGKVYYFNAHDLKLHKNVYVIVETEKGQQYGKIIEKIPENKVNKMDNYKDIIRVATKEDYNKYLENLKDAQKALTKAKELAKNLGLDMYFLSANFTFDKKQLLFNFTAEERVDFRELTKKLAAIYHTRIELHQIGARDKASSVGGIGQCGRELCCSSFLKTLESVSMNMAKNQNLALTPSKINGACGRLLCCLAYEDANYLESQKGLPSVGDIITTNNVRGKVISVDILNRKIRLDCGNEIQEMDLKNESHK